MSSKNKLIQMILSALFLAIALVLPFLTGQIPQIGGMLCPMHLPIILCGFFCGPWFALGIGLLAPILRFFLFGMPPIVPTGISMCFELATYGFVSGALYYLLPKRKSSVYISLVVAMIVGRVVWGISKVILLGLGKIDFGWKIFFTEGFVKAIPGIVVQILLVPILVISLNKSKSE